MVSIQTYGRVCLCNNTKYYSIAMCVNHGIWKCENKVFYPFYISPIMTLANLFGLHICVAPINMQSVAKEARGYWLFETNKSILHTNDTIMIFLKINIYWWCMCRYIIQYSMFMMVISSVGCTMKIVSSILFEIVFLAIIGMLPLALLLNAYTF